ncbi:hypothetical protein V2J09_018218 [Rumex salicifolius]
MEKALVFQWPKTYHQLCIWQIYQNTVIHLNNVFREYKDFSADFSKCVYEYDYEEEYLDAWNKMLDKYSLQDNGWIKRLFNVKKNGHWSTKEILFCTDMMSTQQSESMNKVIKEYISYKNNLRTFFKKFSTSQSKVALSVPIKIGTHVALVYTPKEVLRKGYDCHIEIPEKYILKIWTKDAKKGSNKVINDDSADLSPRRAIERRYKDLCRISTRLPTRVANFEEIYNMMGDSLMNLLKEFDLRCVGHRPFESNIGVPKW